MRRMSSLSSLSHLPFPFSVPLDRWTTARHISSRTESRHLSCCSTLFFLFIFIISPPLFFSLFRKDRRKTPHKTYDLGQTRIMIEAPPTYSRSSSFHPSTPSSSRCNVRRRKVIQELVASFCSSPPNPCLQGGVALAPNKLNHKK
jgi:hypothetical protein